LTRWVVKLCREVPEDRWFRRVILRCRVRVIIAGVYVPRAVHASWSLNSSNDCSFTVDAVDPLSFLLSKEVIS
jgi:hypothetical protein